MNDNYLWDRSGEPDPEIQELEKILGTLRYQPRPLEIPADIRIGQRRRFLPAMAIAATIVLFAVLVGVWFGFNRRPAPVVQAKQDKAIEQKVSMPEPQLKPEESASQTAATHSFTPTIGHRLAPRNLLASNKGRGTRAVIREPQLTPAELAEKKQVLTALRLVSYKLSVAQRKTQGGPPQLNTIRNQHKIG
jgi:hypothetical protein